MKHAKLIVTSIILLATLPLFFFEIACNQTSTAQQPDSIAAPKELSNAEKIMRGKYLMTIGSCGDCHTPKIFTAAGPVPDTTKLYSGHPGSTPLLPIDKKVLQPANWALIAPDLTAFVGPFGISYASNLTPDSATGLGAWSEDTFVKTLRTGRHLGQDGGRQILPPMPWYFIGQATDEDLKSIYTYLRAIPPISNKVPAPVSPPDLAKMK